jgi:hypothetical protein
MFDLAFCLTSEVLTGACCNDYTGECLDDVDQADCPQGWRFVANTLCADLEPPCGTPGACCVEDECVATTLESECDQMGGTWYEGETCPEFICPVEMVCPPDAIWSQTPFGNTAGTSDDALFYKRFDNYYVEEEICDIHFWGINGFWDPTQGWIICVEDPMPFLIEFWADDGMGAPDLAAGPVCTYTIAIAPVYQGNDFVPGWPIYYYSTDLEPCCQLLSGWVSVQGSGDPMCSFLWMDSHDGDMLSWMQFEEFGDSLMAIEYDLAFCLTPSSGPEGYPYLPGDANMYNAGNTNPATWPPMVIGSDVTYLVNYFRGLPTSPPCPLPPEDFWCSADANGDCLVIGSDVTKLVNYFRGLTEVEWCGNDGVPPDPASYPPLWPTPDDLPPNPPPGWPPCNPPE